MGRRDAMRVAEGKKGLGLLAIKMMARTVVRRRKKSLLSDPESELRPGMEKEKD